MSPRDYLWQTDDEIRRSALVREPSMEIIRQYRTWAVTTFGMECLSEWYEISADELKRGPGSYETWLEHLRRKPWTVNVDVATCYADAMAYHVGAQGA